jgi:hypothetical protein
MTTRDIRRLAILPALALLPACRGSVATVSPAPTQTPAPAVAAQTPAPDRPVPYHLLESAGFARAVANGTRTRSGQPGPRYWQQWSRYSLAANYDPATGRLSGTGTVRYYNRSPDSLPTIFVHVRANLFGPEAYRNRQIPTVGDVSFSRVAAQGQALADTTGSRRPGRPRPTGYHVDGTVMQIVLPHAVPAGDSLDLQFTWQYTVPPEGGPRGGRNDMFAFVSYWYPQLAVYDDVNGWQADQYRGNGEFYMGYGDYDVAVTVPAGYLVAATGTLTNPEDVLSPQTRERLGLARSADSVVHVVAAADRGAGTATASGATLTWRFQARGVRDFDWGTSDKYVWDATRALPGDANGDGRPDTTAINAFWVPELPGTSWADGARDTRYAIEFLSRFLWPYPWPQMTAVNGPSCGGMEFPMITCITGGRDSIGLASVIVHETGHMWFPMQVGSDEKSHAWQDEGFTQFDASQGMDSLYASAREEAQNRQIYLFWARLGNEVDLMRHGDLYPLNSPAFGIASYMKTATILGMLRSMLGVETFMTAYRGYGRRWQYRHPQPEDFWYSIDDLSHRDLWWFWRTWFYETWTLDQAVGSVTRNGATTEISIADRGLAPMPVPLAITRADGSVERRTIPVDVWLGGRNRTTVSVPTGAGVTGVVIDPDGLYPDTDRGNNAWPSQPGR